MEVNFFQRCKGNSLGKYSLFKKWVEPIGFPYRKNNNFDPYFVPQYRIT